MNRLTLLISVALVFFMSCSGMKNSNSENNKSSEIYLFGRTTATEYQIAYPCSIVIQTPKKIIAQTSSNDSGFYELYMKLKNSDDSVFAVVTPLLETMIKDTIIGPANSITIGCKNKLTNVVSSDTFNIDVSRKRQDFNLQKCHYFIYTGKTVSH